jgi:hypothetical protein
MKPSSFSAPGANWQRYQIFLFATVGGSTSKMTAIMSSTLETRDAQAVRWFDHDELQASFTSCFPKFAPFSIR